MKYFKQSPFYYRMVVPIVLMLVLIVAPYQLLAQDTSGTANDESEESDNSFEFSGDYTSVVFAEDNERTVLRGDAKIISKTTQLFSDSIEVFGTDFRYASSIGNVVVVDTEQNYRLSAQELWFDREDEILRARGQAVLEDYDNELVIKGEIIEFRNKEQLSEIQRGVRILGEDIIARSEYVRYNRETEVVEFSGLPVVEWKEDEYSAARIILDMDDDTVELQGQVFGKIQVEDEEEEDIEQQPSEDQEEIESEAALEEEQESEQQSDESEENDVEADTVTEIEQEPLENEENQQDSDVGDETFDSRTESELESVDDEELIEDDTTPSDPTQVETPTPNNEETTVNSTETVDSGDEIEQRLDEDEVDIENEEESEQEPTQAEQEIDGDTVLTEEQESAPQAAEGGEVDGKDGGIKPELMGDKEQREHSTENQDESGVDDETIEDGTDSNPMTTDKDESIEDDATPSDPTQKDESIEDDATPSDPTQVETPSNDKDTIVDSIGTIDTIETIDSDSENEQPNTKQLPDDEPKKLDEKINNEIIEGDAESDATPHNPTGSEELSPTPSVETTDETSVELKVESPQSDPNTFPLPDSSLQDKNISDSSENERDRSR